MSQPVRMREKVILRVVTKALLPFILLFALYVQFHGDFGPGGGFQAGVIFAAGLIVYGLIYGLPRLQALVPPPLAEIGIAVGVMIYGGTGLVTMLLGGEFLAYDLLDPSSPAHGQHLGIMLVEAGVGVGVASAMLTIYYYIAGRGIRA